jgi:hypothetical protein
MYIVDMQSPAQSEKRATFPEGGRPAGKGRLCHVERIAPESAALPSKVDRRAGRMVFLEACEESSYRFIFNGLDGFETVAAKRRTDAIHYPFSKQLSAIPHGWFGPNFVTISPQEVGVCSI